MQIDPEAAYPGTFVQQVIDAVADQCRFQMDALREQRNGALDQAAAALAAATAKDARIAELQQRADSLQQALDAAAVPTPEPEADENED